MLSPKHETSPENGGSRNADEDLAQLWREVRGDLGNVAKEAGTIARLRSARIGLALREGAHGLLFALFGALAAVVVTLVGAVVFVLGLAGGLSALFGGLGWAGRLSAGFLILAGGAAALLFLRERMRQKFLETLEKRFGSVPQDENTVGSPS